MSMEKSPPPHNGNYPSYYAPPRKHEKSHWPIFTLVAVVANIIVFIVVMYENNCPAKIGPGRTCVLGSSFKRMSFQPWSENPLLGPSSATLVKMGGLRTVLVVDQKEGWRLMSCVWLHAGVFHLLVNMIAVLVLGLPLEKTFGFIRVGVLYLASGLGGSLLSSLFNQNGVSVGASGALFGLLGGTISDVIINWSLYSNYCGVLLNLIILAAINLAIGLLPLVDNFAHIGGFLTGLLLGCVLLMKTQHGYVPRRDLLDPNMERPVKNRFNAFQIILFIISALVLIAGFIGGFVALYNRVDAHKKCSWCHYLNCVPSSHWTCDS
ncbi:RHOMBOID-like protein 2 [Physcomitrium patens]|uniref:RHOMBOID-like protein n=1 Tax=Physcomitrium patens TaxID=3218 RepID=A9U4D9_PHYPA|nr:RHOMBOID-like protein 2 [Physcomitrium patens]XP_024395108.1 RHOMBOID-like protein 2 [Physcomitrium patens]XP_024395109.1 RHOMBOID-like protein 2 [Physcomitrium patens]XP_024395111.1 RHOMBOID-like protein 2 [Physcomitrium patens]XP_024395112.1 RHOMBOID-like protein 2 [Physcomitrium patens]PNR40909.1 hypothetical protein PHYPA_018312 [Physcomitrium patens]|eukprot:XP_024395107.1 RHOMBOID-like protein 2 [Physcomitrella patens]